MSDRETNNIASITELRAKSDYVQEFFNQIIVNSTGDQPDINPGDGIADIGNGNVTLRAAIEEANARPGVDLIQFNILGGGPFSIQPGSPLPEITDPIIIDGTTQPGYAGLPIVELDGTVALDGETAVDGLRISAGNSIIKGLVINGFSGYGLVLNSNGENVIEGNFIGTDIAGLTDAGNALGGIYIGAGSDGNTIGGTSAEKRNLISGNGDENNQSLRSWISRSMDRWLK